MSRAWTWIVAGLLAAGGAAAQDGAEWLPARVADGAAQQLSGRLAEAGFGVEAPAQRAEAARTVVAALRGTLDAWGPDGALSRAPEFPELPVPKVDDRLLDGMARWYVCNMVLFLQHGDPAFAGDVNARLTAALGLTGVSLAVLRLRQPYLAAGRDAGAIERLLAGDAMAPVLERLQADAAARGHAESRCRDPIVALLERPLADLAALGEGAQRSEP